MPVSALLAAVMVAAQGDARYSPDIHVATISRRLKEVSAKLKAVEEGAPTTPVAGLLGQCIGEDRRNQAALSTYLRKAKGTDATVALRTVRLAGMWQAYLASAVLAIGGDEESKDLSGFLEHRISRLLATKAPVG